MGSSLKWRRLDQPLTVPRGFTSNSSRNSLRVVTEKRACPANGVTHALPEASTGGGEGEGGGGGGEGTGGGKGGPTQATFVSCQRPLLHVMIPCVAYPVLHAMLQERPSYCPAQFEYDAVCICESVTPAASIAAAGVPALATVHAGPVLEMARLKE